METVGDNADGNNVTSAMSRKQLYKYDFVINNYTLETMETMNITLKKICKKCVYGLEVGESGTPHIQGYMSLIKKARIVELTKLQGLERASLRAVRNEQACIEYCQKENVKFKFGFPVELKVIKDLKMWQKEIEEKCLKTPDERTINWLYDGRTNIGKTVFTKYMVHKYNAIFFTGGKKSDIACQLALEKQNGRDLNNNMIIIFNYSEGDNDIEYQAFEALKDGLISSSKYKSSGLIFNPPHIWIMANSLPDENIIRRRLNVWKTWEVKEDKLSLIA